VTIALPPHVQEEVAYAADLFQRAEKALSREMTALRAAGVPLAHKDLIDLDVALSRVSSGLRILSIEQERASK
jgi:hypothetical protein